MDISLRIDDAKTKVEDITDYGEDDLFCRVIQSRIDFKDNDKE